MSAPIMHRPGAVALRKHAGDTLDAIGSLRIIEILLGATLVVQVSIGVLPVGLNELMSLVIIAFALFRRRIPGVEYPSWLIPVLALGICYILLISLFADPSEFAFDWRRRLIRIGITVALMLILASGRIDVRSLLAGLGAGLVVNAVLFYAGIAPDTYGGALSGFFDDKNVAGLATALWGLLFLGTVRGIWARILVAGAASILVYLTDSRTSMAAFVLGVVWMLLAPRLPLAGKWLLGVAITIVSVTASEDFSQIGRFSGRVGSDALRARIDAASETKVGETGFFGAGLGEAYVRIADHTWLFHNSFWTLLVEGGWPWFLCILGVTVFAALRPFHGARLTRLELGAQAATIVLMLCGWRLGEVFLTQEWALVMGVALLGRGLSRRRTSEEQEAPAERQAAAHAW